MRIADYIVRIIRSLIRSYEWASGRRHYPWTSSPPHRMFAMMANRARGWPGAQYRALYMFSTGVLKFDERLNADRINYNVELDAPVDAATLAQAALRERAVLTASAAARHHLNVHVRGDDDRVQLDRYAALLLMSDAIGSINFFFDEEAAHDARLHALTVAEERRGWRNVADLADRDAGNAVFDGSEWSRIFSMRSGFDRAANQYLKIAHAGARVIAVSLPEDASGFCDESLPRWCEAIASFGVEIPDLRFVLLNRVGPAALRMLEGASRVPLVSASRAGLSFAESVFLAQKADAYVGEMNVFGLAARVARRPGVYMSASGNAGADRTDDMIHTARLDAREALARLGDIVQPLPQHGGHDTLAPTYLGPAPVTDVPSLRAPQQHIDRGIPARSQNGIKPRANLPATQEPQTLADYTLVIPTYNRSALLERLLSYLSRQSVTFTVLVLDSSEPAVQEQNAKTIAAMPRVRHLDFAQTTDPYVKMREGLLAVTTQFCSLCADDDLILPAAVQRCVDALQEDAKAAVAHGYYFNFGETATFDLSSIVYRSPSIDDRDAIERLRTLFSAYEAVLYGVYRTEIAQRVFRDVDRLDAVLGKELITGALTAIAGKCLRVPEFYYGRNTAESLSYRGWHPHQMLAQDPPRLFSSYLPFRELVSEALVEAQAGPDVASAARILDLIMLRYLKPFLREDVLDLLIDEMVRGTQPDVIVNRLWDMFVRLPRSPRPLAPLLARESAFVPQEFGAGRARDYQYSSVSWEGRARDYRVFYEFMYPDLQPPAAVGREQLLALIAALDAY